MRAAKVQASLRIRAVSPEPSLLAHTSSESRGTFRQKARSLAPLNGWACAVEICHDGMLEDTNSLDGAHMSIFRNNNGCIKPRKQRTSILHESQSYYLSRLATKPTKWMCSQRRVRPAWACTQSDQSLRCPHEEALGPWLSIECTAKTLFRLGTCPVWSESLLGAQIICLFCHDVAQFWCVCCLFDVYECSTVFWRFSLFMISLKFTLLNVSWLLDWLRRFNASVLEPYNCRYHIFADNIVFQFSSSNVIITKF